MGYFVSHAPLRGVVSLFFLLFVSPGFNPCSLGCFPRSRRFLSTRFPPGSFNPCSLGCFPRSRVRIVVFPCVLVSILVLLDVFLEAIKPVHSHGFSRFQSLFSWMFSSKHVVRCDGIRCPCSFNPCSLGCFPRRLTHRVKELEEAKSFNPCSLGCFPRSLRGLLWPCVASVSILVLLDVFLEGYTVIRVAGQCGFQSLFSWMFSSKIDIHETHAIDPGFNPCSLGCFPRRTICSLSSPRQSLFQSLFSWMFSSKVDHSTVNPCSLGCFLEVRRSTMCFNPCSLGCFPRRCCGRVDVSLTRVSILVLLDVFLEVLRRHYESCDWQFQSLFSWMFSSKTLLHARIQRVFYVSILVLLDVFLEAVDKKAFVVLDSGFNPCSLGCFPRSDTHDPLGRLDHGFNPCSLGCFPRRSAIRSAW